MTTNKEEIKIEEEMNEDEISEESIEEEDHSMEEEKDVNVEFNQNAKWLQELFNAPQFVKWRATKAAEEGKGENYIVNLLTDHNLKIKTCNDVADFIMEHCNPKDVLRKSPKKKNDKVEELMKKANKRYWSVVEKSKTSESKKPKKN